MPHPKSQFPEKIWDGTSSTRKASFGDAFFADRPPDAFDYDQLRAEIQATQEVLMGLMHSAGGGGSPQSAQTLSEVKSVLANVTGKLEAIYQIYLQIKGNILRNTRIVTKDTILDKNDDIIIINAPFVNITLQDATIVPDKRIILKPLANYRFWYSTQKNQQVDLQNFPKFPNTDILHLFSDGSNWWII